MLLRNRITVATLSLLVAAGLAAGEAAQAKGKKKVRRSSHPLLVPPPPAYMPTILPELQVARKKKATVAKESTKKYIYTREGYEDPRPVKPNKHVTYWNGNGS